MMRGKIIKGLVLSSLSLGIFVGANSVTNGVSFNDNALAKATTKVTHKKSKSTAKKISVKFLKDSKVSKSGYIAKTHGARIKLSTLKKYYGPSKFIGDDGAHQRVATTTSGNKIYWNKEHPQYATEVMPGTHSNSETFTNPTKHWVMYWLGGNLPDDFSHKGFKDQYKQYSEITSEYPIFLSGKYGNFNGSALYSWHQKILLVSKKWYNYDTRPIVGN